MPNVRATNRKNAQFTVLMSVYAKDDPMLFERAVESVYQNSILPSYFVLVVDGCVPTLLEDKISRLANIHNIDVVWLPSNVGLAAALNEGLKHVLTEWVVRADADDFNLPTRFESQLTLMNERLDLFGSAILEIDRSGQRLGIRRPPTASGDIIAFSRFRNPFNHMSVAFRTAFANRCGGYPNIFLKEDYAFWALMLKNGARVANMPDVLVEVTAGADMYKRRGGVKYALAEFRLQRHLAYCGIKTALSAWPSGLARALVFLLPSAIRGYLYEAFLRERFN